MEVISGLRILTAVVLCTAPTFASDYTCARTGRTLPNAAPPCDLGADSFCASSGKEYPWGQIRKWVFENQALIKRMYGNQKHYSILKEEFEVMHSKPSNMYSPEAQDIRPESFAEGKLRNSARSRGFQESRSDDFLYQDVIKEEEKVFKRDVNRGRSISGDSPSSRHDNLIRDLVVKLDKESGQIATDPSIGTVSITKSYSTQSVSSKISYSSSISTTTPPPEIMTELQPPNEDADSDFTTSETDFTTVDEIEEMTVDPQILKVTTEGTSALTESYSNEDKITTPEGTLETSAEMEEYYEVEAESTTGFPVEDENYTTNDSVMSESSTQKQEDLYVDAEAIFDYETDVTTAKITEKAMNKTSVEDERLIGISALARVTSEQLPAETRQSDDVQVDIGSESRTHEIKFRFPKDSAEETIIEKPAVPVTVKAVTGEKRSSNKPETVSQQNTREIQKLREQPVVTTDSSQGGDTLIPDHGITSRQPPGRGQALFKRPDQIEKPKPASVIDTDQPRYTQPPNSPARPTGPVTPPTTPAPTPASATPRPTPTVNKGVNACPVEADVVAPYWANNTRGEVLALLNMAPFEQYVHWEKCKFEYRQMYCRPGCRCEQQYRLHRMLAFDPQDDCRGIFSDWFRFPSGCVCMCYDISEDAAPEVKYVTDYRRKPRLSDLDSVKDSDQEGKQLQPEEERNPNDLTDVFFMTEEDIEVPELVDSDDQEFQRRELTPQFQTEVEMEEEIQEVPEVMPALRPLVYQYRAADSSSVSAMPRLGSSISAQQLMSVINGLRGLHTYPMKSKQIYNLRYSPPKTYLKYTNPRQNSRYKRLGYQSRSGLGNQRQPSSLRKAHQHKRIGNWNPQASFPPSLSNPNFKKYSQLPAPEQDNGSNNLNFRDMTRARSLRMPSQNEIKESPRAPTRLDAHEPQYFFNLTSHLIRSRQLD